MEDSSTVIEWRNEIKSVTTLGEFYKALGNKLSHKSSQNIWCLLGLFLIMSLVCKKCVAAIWAIFAGNYVSSGHAGHNRLQYATGN